MTCLDKITTSEVVAITDFHTSNLVPASLFISHVFMKVWRLLVHWPAFHGHAGNISVNYSVYGYNESNLAGIERLTSFGVLDIPVC